MTPAGRGLSVLHRAFVALVFVAGAAAVGHAVWTVAHEQSGHAWIVLALVTLAGGLFPIKVPGISATLSISETFLFAIVLMYGPGPAVVTVAVDGLLVSLVRRHREARHAAFNMAEPAVSMWLAAQLYYWLTGLPPLSVAPATISAIGPAAIALSAAYFVLNSGLNAAAMATETGRSPLELWRKFFVWVSLSYFGGASIAVLLTVNGAGGPDWTSWVSVLLAIAPLVIVTYFAFRSSMGRLEDENVHLSEVNRLYLKMVETLAMAVDAKDQVTSGHVHRVQTFALRLAKTIGVSEPQQLKAIEAAALLHDIGKLAVPEHILNKPGKLTEFEYDRMKQHAPLGADMLSAVDFPYPVVPIVRHHHENWDGTGYPDALAGEAIPIGARVLAVVDCYDALRSHRPYRRALGPDEAMAIVRERRGSMYDPAVVEAFEGIQCVIEAEGVSEPVPEVIDRVAQFTREIRAEPETGTLPLHARLHATDTLLRLYERLATLEPDASAVDLCEVVTRYLRRLAPASLAVFYGRDEAEDRLSVLCASGFGESLTNGLTIPMGHGVSGWVAAQRRSVINADAALDLGDRSLELTPRHRSVLAVPLLVDSRIVGTMTLYSIQAGAFSDEQRLALELLAPPIADALVRTLAREALGTRKLDEPRAAQHGQTLNALLQHDELWASWNGRPLGVLCVAARGNADLMAHASVAVGMATRVADLVFRPGDDELVVLMPDCDIGAGQLIVERVLSAMPKHLAAAPGPASGRDGLAIGFACAPHDGNGLSRLLTTARARLGPVGVQAAESRGSLDVAVLRGGEPWPA